MLLFFVGLWLGSAVGFIAAGLLGAAATADREVQAYRHGFNAGAKSKVNV